MSFATAQDGTKIYYETYGDGKPVLFIHGGGGNTIVWYQQVPIFSETHKVIVMDLRGFKSSVCPTERIHPRYFPGDVLAILDQERIEKISLVCDSLGAWAGVPLAVRNPERVHSLFISGSPTPIYSEKTWDILKTAAQTFDNGGDDLRSKSIGWNRKKINPTVLYLYGRLKALNPKGFKALTMQSDDVKIYPSDLIGYSVPTLMTGGSHDDFLTPDIHHLATELIPGCKSYTFQDAGHFPYFETPDEFNSVLARFLEEQRW
ncbi:MAG: alpha/beta fold hydrolase [Longimicrobiales bacterium]